ncbi:MULTISPECIES: arginase family protein [unclassified Streptomyces]|uniref:arginase family protein n=1 Tax=unclassified Streptomyces TaxID=2593676 RepID=UPI00224F60B4|nr:MULTISPECIES: arginase family protein [unclassified Streptomyces]MCX4528911.1 arginase family protein [Streptomyces sp. NBC_01551]MCX4540418.1 arginase family protein [Streptomyces sp. NBC_01565]
MRSLVLLDAPSNLGLRPPAPGTVPGVYKLAGALREQGLLSRLGAREGGVVVPPRYDRGSWKEGDGVFHAAPLAAYTVALADRIETHLRAGEFPVVLGGDCSIQLGASLAMRRLGRYGLAAIDGSADFRHPGNEAVNGPVGAAGGEELALATGRGQADLTDLEGLRPYLRDQDVRLFGLRDGDEDLPELRAAGMTAATVGDIRARGAAQVARAALDGLHPPDTAGFWVHLDADVLDPAVMPAVDSPDPGGLLPGELAELLAVLVGSPRCVGLNVTIYDPDLDPDLRAGALLADLVAGALA